MGYRYIGSKEKLALSIIDIIKSELPNAKTAIDLMAGTGSMSSALCHAGYIVTAADVMTYSYHHLMVKLKMSGIPFFNGLVGIVPNLTADDNRNYDIVLNYLNSLSLTQGYFFNEFSPLGKPKDATKPRCYYSPENAAKIDAIRLKIKEWHTNGFISDIEHSLLLHNLILDSNDIANIAGTYGHYLSHFVKRSLDPIMLKPIEPPHIKNGDSHKVFKGYAEELAKKLTADFCYIDPPYIKRQYAANYHILETLAREDFPDAIGESGLRPWRDQYSNFCSKIKIRSSFNAILTGVNTNDFFISYSEDGLLGLDELMAFLSQYGTVKLFKIEHKRFKSNNSKKSPVIIEYLFHLHK